MAFHMRSSVIDAISSEERNHFGWIQWENMQVFLFVKH